ncbi:MAG: hypothetical protein GY748_05420, partial [Planctomycetaceae bacterium]|nr:hypothetical protein [Planctomycetaceae bacterium]
MKFGSLGIVFVLLSLFVSHLQSEEGMFPVSDIYALNLMEKGLEISPTDIYNPDGICLV